MKKLITITITVLIQITGFTQEIPFDGIYKGSSNGISYTLYLKNNNGVINGTIRNSEKATIESTISATVNNVKYITGTQKEGKKEIQFTAVEENDQIIWERKNKFFGKLFNKKETIIKYTKTGSNPREPTDNLQNENGK